MNSESRRMPKNTVASTDRWFRYMLKKKKDSQKDTLAFSDDGYTKKSFSQSGEDLIIDYILKNHYATQLPNYLDIGAYNPIIISNTYLFYERGSRGVLIEPDFDLAKVIRKKRPQDTVLNIGISSEESVKDFYLVTPATLNTFSKNEYEQYCLFYPDTTLRRIVKTKTLPISKLLDKYFKNGLDLLSIDVEGLDYEILSSINLTTHRPKIICIETVQYEKDNTWRKPENIASYMYSNSYFLYADTFINSIFVDEISWLKYGQPKLKNFSRR